MRTCTNTNCTRHKSDNSNYCIECTGELIKQISEKSQISETAIRRAIAYHIKDLDFMVNVSGAAYIVANHLAVIVEEEELI